MIRNVSGLEEKKLKGFYYLFEIFWDFWGFFGIFWDFFNFWGFLALPARGYLPVDEFKAILRELDDEIPDNELDQIIDEIDSDSSGTVDFEGKNSAFSPGKIDLIEGNPHFFFLEFMAVMTGE